MCVDLLFASWCSQAQIRGQDCRVKREEGCIKDEQLQQLGFKFLSSRCWVSSFVSRATSSSRLRKLPLAALYIARSSKVSSHLPTGSCRRHGVPKSVSVAAWQAEEFIYGNKLQKQGKRLCRVLKTNMREYDELWSCRSMSLRRDLATGQETWTAPAAVPARAPKRLGSAPPSRALATLETQEKPMPGAHWLIPGPCPYLTSLFPFVHKKRRESQTAFADQNSCQRNVSGVPGTGSRCAAHDSSQPLRRSPIWWTQHLQVNLQVGQTGLDRSYTVRTDGCVREAD